MSSDTEFTLAHVARLDLLIRRETIRARRERAGLGARGDDEYRGLYVSDADADALLARTLTASAMPPPSEPPDDGLAAFDGALAAVDERIGALRSSARQRGETPRLDRLCRLFGLEEFEREVLVVALAAELDLKYERLYAYLQDDVTKKRPTVDLALRLLCPSLEERLAARRAFEPEAPLLRWQLVSLHDDPGARHPVLLARYLKLDERVAAFLLGSDALDARLVPLAAPAGAGVLTPAIRQRVAAWGTAWRATGGFDAAGPDTTAPHDGGPARAPVVLFHGRYGAGRRAAAGALADALGRPLLLLNAAGLPVGPPALVEALMLAEREALLTGALLCWADAGGWLEFHPGDPARETAQRTYVQALARGRVPTALLAEQPWEPARYLEQRPFLRLELPEASFAERRAAWLAGLSGGPAGPISPIRHLAAPADLHAPKPTGDWPDGTPVAAPQLDGSQVNGLPAPAAQSNGGPLTGLPAPAARAGGARRGEGQLGEGQLNAAHLDTLAGRFRLTTGQIQDALAQARMLAWARDPQGGRVTAADVDAACRAQAQHRLGTLARKLTPRYTWDDIVLPAPQLATLRLIGTMIRRRATVYGDWGFDRKLASGKGVLALFAGPSGTGKTMAAEILAQDLGLDAYKIDLSAVVNKYVGETEKNLEKLFTEAQDSDAILFFDEADALFGKRSGVSDAHDRYANVETAYLLQRVEEYNGLVVLASNLPKNMDEAFVRRLHFTVNFPAPEETERLEIWQRTFPEIAPRDGDVDLPFLARKLKISGGNIRNIILCAAFLAAEDGRPIAMRHLVPAARYEFQKMGKMVLESDFERYIDLARAP